MKIRCAMPAGHRPDCPWTHGPETSAPTAPPEPYLPPASMDDLNERLLANLGYSGSGAETTVHMPCGFCAAPDWAVYPVLETAQQMTRDRMCAACGRSGLFLLQAEPGVMTFEFVQTGGDDPPEWLQSPPRRT